METNLNGARCVFNASAGPSFAPHHRSIVECATVLLEQELLVTAGTTHVINIWSLVTGQMVCNVLSPDLHCTCLAGFDTGYVQSGCARILVGHANGNIHDFVLSFKEQFEENVLDSLEQTTQVASVALQESSVQSLVTSVDILDVVDETSETVTTEQLTNKEIKFLSSTQNGGLPLSQQTAQRQNDRTIKYSCRLHETLTYCPLPVTSLLFSSLGLYYSACYAQQTIIVHDWEQQVRDITPLMIFKFLIEFFI